MTQIVVCPPDGEPVTRPLGDWTARLPIETYRPVRTFVSWRGKRNQEGMWWWSKGPKHVPFESWAERNYLVWADFDPDVADVSAQPVGFLWPRMSEQKNHVADFFVRLTSGLGRVVDVRPEALIDDRAQWQFDQTREACRQIGWTYEVFSGQSEARLGNLLALSAYANPRSWQPTSEVHDAIMGVFGNNPVPLQDGVDWAARVVKLPQHQTLGYVYHMLWTHRLNFDVDMSLSMRTAVWA